MLLCLVAPGVYLLGARLTELLADQPRDRLLLSPAAALGAWMVGVSSAGLATGSFVIGLTAGTLGAAAVGTGWTLLQRRAGMLPRAVTTGASSSRAMLVSGCVLALPVVYLTLAGDFFDDFNAVGHRSLVAQFQNDQFPPLHQVFPEYPFRYHYGFNLVAAALTAMLRLSIGVAIDLLVIAGFFWSWCLAWRLGERLTGSRSGGWTALATLLSGGAFFWFIAYDDWATQGAMGIVIGGNRINLPVYMYFFQKPLALGFPLALALMLAAAIRSAKARWLQRSLLLAVLLAPLSLVQEALFVTMGPCLAVHELLRDRRPRAVLPVLLAIALAALMGGVLVSVASGDHTGLVRARFWLAKGDPLGVLAWYFLTTGLLIPVALAGLRFMPTMRIFLLLLMTGSFSIPLFFENPVAWDIVKLATIGQLAAGVACGSMLAWLAEGRSWLRRSTLLVLTLGLVASPIGYVSYWIDEMIHPTPEIGQKLAAQRSVRPNASWAPIIAWLRTAEHYRGTVYSSNPLFVYEMLLNGINSASPPRLVDVEFGISYERIERRRVHLANLPEDHRAWLAERIFWVMTFPDDPLRDTVARWESIGGAHKVFESGRWSLYQLSGE